MADVQWIKITTDFYNNRKIKQIRKMPDGDSIALLWVFLVCMAGECNSGGIVNLTQEIPYTPEMLSIAFEMNLKTVQMGLNIFQQFGMIEIVDNFMSLKNWEKYQNIEGLDKIREQTRQRVARHRENKALETKCNVTGNVTVTHGNATDIDKELEIDKEIDKDTMAENPPDYESFFEDVWSLYPNKKGKSSITKSKKKELFKVGEDLRTAVENYKEEIRILKTEQQYIKHGSTFFRTAYKDYLPGTYQRPKGTGSFAGYEQRQSDYNEAIMGWSDDN